MTMNLICPRLGKAGSAWLAHASEGWFDSWASRRINGIKPNVVVAYENAALRCFEQAKRCNAKTVLDAASVCHAMQDRFLRYDETPDVHSRIIARKAREIELTDLILTASPLARESYIEYGVNPIKVACVPMGVDLDRFQFRPPASRNSDSIVRFVFVGRLVELKGADWIHSACKSNRLDRSRYSLTLIGDEANPDRWTPFPNVRVLGRLDQMRLASELKSSDVLILPSRFDSFGMVVVEAMATGLPTIVSPNAGSKLLVHDGENGKLMNAACDQSLIEAMAWFIEHSTEIPEMSYRARAVAERYSWRQYRQSIVDQMSSFMESK